MNTIPLAVTTLFYVCFFFYSVNKLLQFDVREKLPQSIIRVNLPDRSVRNTDLFIYLEIVFVSSESVSFALCLAMNFNYFSYCLLISKHNEE